VLREKVYRILFILMVFFPLSVIADNGRVMHIIKVNNREYISLFELCKVLNIDPSYDVYTRKGKLYRKSHFAIYNEGFCYLLIDGILSKSEYPVTRHRGGIVFPLKSGRDLVRNFFPGSDLLRRGNNFVISRKARFKRTEVSKKNQSLKQDSGKGRIDFIVIDPGHGGRDPGATGKGSVKEKDITLKISKYLEFNLKKKLKGIRIILTRRTDKFVTLAGRTKIANRYIKKNNNGIFLSVHVNASLFKKVSGFETYFLSQNPTNDEARNTAALENNVIIVYEKKGNRGSSHDDADYIEAMMLTTQIQKESSILADSIQKGMNNKNHQFSSRGVRKADFFVLRGVLMPAVLVETGFITNAKEAGFLVKKNYQKKIARGIADGVLMFLKKYDNLIK